MKNSLLLFINLLLFLGCSQTSYNYRERQGIPPKKFHLVGKIDSTNVIASVKPSDYRWNEDDNLIDVIRKKYKVPKIDPNYPNPFSPPSYSPSFINFCIAQNDSMKFFICNEDESSCYKFQEGYFEKGYYSLGFQKLDIDTSIFIIRIEYPDTTLSKKIIYMP